MTATLADDLVALLGARGLTVVREARLADYTTFRLGGPCPLLIGCRTPAELAATVRELLARRLPFRLIGGGSNLLVSDHGLPTIVVRYASDEPAIALHGDRLEVSGATRFDDLGRFAADRGGTGLVQASGIPGTVGGAMVGNAGAFGWQLGDEVLTVRLLDAAGDEHTVPAAELGFTYRDSGLKHRGETVLSAILRWRPGDPAFTAAERERILALRATKHPDLQRNPCAGSFFRNLEPTSAAARRQAAGFFLEQVGAKEMRVGGARVFPRHANIIVKGDDACRATDVLALSRQMVAAVQARFGFALVREVQLLGEFPA